MVHRDEGFRGLLFAQKRIVVRRGLDWVPLFMEYSGTCLGFGVSAAGVHRIRMRQWKPFPSNATDLAWVQKCSFGDSFIRVGSMLACVFNEAKGFYLGKETLKP